MTATTMCPKWCTEHYADSVDDLHMTTLAVEFEGVSAVDVPASLVIVPAVEGARRWVDLGTDDQDLLAGMTPATARQFAAALVKAADMLDALG